MSKQLDNQILFLSKNGPHRNQLRKSLAMMHYKVDFVSTLMDVLPAIGSFKSSVFIHDWSASDPSQARKFHQSWPKGMIHILRITIHPELKPSVLAFANDVGIDKVVSSSEASLALATTIEMLRSKQGSEELNLMLKRLSAGDDNYVQADLDENVEEAYKQYQHNPKVKLEYGNLAFRKDELQTAENIALELTTKEPTNLRANNLLAKVLMKTSRWSQATSLLEAANQLSPQNPERLVMLGDAFYGSGDLDKAMGYYHEALDLQEDLQLDTNDTVEKVAQVKIDLGEMEEAFELLHKSASEEEAAGYFNNAAVLASKKQNYENALKLYKTALKALKTDKLKPIIYTNMSISQRKLGQIADAQKSIQRALKYDPKYKKALDQKEKLQQSKAG
ncbi:tetratricopeptide repeat protein [Pseudobacteriovorax antillogorgiicola]|uniref:Tetratricopeptide repeat-containing protein n=1 Tax=Pseudobacteriovorax antillogorgiicola TaxID=1513793 RepID=A0A1Y6CNI5_9BACT|nr:tetratricopeptide repeat protein [Pseudobacteriovorax antillogorgiicola]TCS47023.1 tetratricopeptide repeat protein [Pseudobacteriovorax antillogorgiicola]SMF65220.1 Tetratricopeptide repeat-containing protein [Pseudobacteriovorax antillogorgiicola]